MHLCHIIWFALPSAGTFELWVQALRHTKVVSVKGIVCQFLPAMLPENMHCVIFKADVLLWAAPVTTACESHQFSHTFFHPVNAVVSASQGEWQHSPKVLHGSCDIEIPDPRAVTQAWEHLFGVFCSTIPTHSAHSAHHDALFLALIPALWFPILSVQQLQSKSFCLVR